MVICNFCGKSLEGCVLKAITKSLRLFDESHREWGGELLIGKEHLCGGCVHKLKIALYAAIRRLRTAPVLERADAKQQP